MRFGLAKLFLLMLIKSNVRELAMINGKND